jgi:hypothetical protein
MHQKFGASCCSCRWGWDCVSELRPQTGLLLIPQEICMNMESYGGTILTGENRRTRRKPCPNAALPTTIPHGLTRARIPASAVRGRRLTAWAMSRPHSILLNALNIWIYLGVSSRPFQFSVLSTLMSKCNRKIGFHQPATKPIACLQGQSVDGVLRNHFLFAVLIGWDVGTLNAAAKSCAVGYLRD